MNGQFQAEAPLLGLPSRTWLDRGLWVMVGDPAPTCSCCDAENLKDPTQLVFPSDSLSHLLPPDSVYLQQWQMHQHQLEMRQW